MKPKPKLTERQAWLKIAREFDEAKKSEFPGDRWGLCFAADCLVFHDHINLETYRAMKARIALYMTKHSLGVGYIYPQTKSGAKKRAALARKFAKECE